jgi:hypothetical protein
VGGLLNLELVENPLHSGDGLQREQSCFKTNYKKQAYKPLKTGLKLAKSSVAESWLNSGLKLA